MNHCRPLIASLFLFASTCVWSQDLSVRTLELDPDSGTWVDLAYANPTTIAGLVRVGKEAWDVLKNSRPVFDVKTDLVSVLPKGIPSPMTLSGWSSHKTKSLKVVVEDFLGVDIVEFTYNIGFDAGGAFKNHGKYLANVSMVPEELKINAAGLKFHAAVKTYEPLNVGTSSDPLASLKVDVTLTVEGLLKTSLKTDEFVIKGDGTYTVSQRSDSNW